MPSYYGETMSKGLLLDFTRCIGCQECEKACAEENHLPDDPPEDKLNYKNFTVVLQRNGLYFRKMCMHCEHPVCESVCPVAALKKTEIGPVIYFPSKCMGCRYCMMACPFQVPKYEWDKPIPIIRKCIMCSHRLEEGRDTACAWVCPTGASRFGERDYLIEIAHKRIQTFPDRYIHKVYGETEVGGTCVLMLSSIPFEELGFRTDLPEYELPELTGTVLRRIPNVVITGGLLLGGISWLVNRRMTLEQEHIEERQKQHSPSKSHGKEHSND